MGNGDGAGKEECWRSLLFCVLSLFLAWERPRPLPKKKTHLVDQSKRAQDAHGQHRSCWESGLGELDGVERIAVALEVPRGRDSGSGGSHLGLLGRVDLVGTRFRVLFFFFFLKGWGKEKVSSLSLSLCLSLKILRNYPQTSNVRGSIP